MKDLNKRMLPWVTAVLIMKMISVVLGFQFSVDHVLSSGGFV